MRILSRLFRLTLLLAAAFAMLAGALFGLHIHQKGWGQWKHERLVERIDRQLLRPGRSAAGDNKQPTREETGRREMIRAFHNALYNSPFYHYQSTVPDKLRAIADRLDANNGADLKSFQGCVELLVLFDHASPTFHDYAWVTMLYEMTADGSIPPLPELGKEWPKEESAAGQK